MTLLIVLRAGGSGDVDVDGIVGLIVVIVSRTAGQSGIMFRLPVPDHGVLQGKLPVADVALVDLLTTRCNLS